LISSEQCYQCDDFVFVPGSLKRENPELCGKFLCH
jgi:hypothetical protein